MSVSRSADSTGAAQVTAQQGAQQHASSTEQQDLQVGPPPICGPCMEGPQCGLLCCGLFKQTWALTLGDCTYLASESRPKPVWQSPSYTLCPSGASDRQTARK